MRDRLAAKLKDLDKQIKEVNEVRKYAQVNFSLKILKKYFSEFWTIFDPVLGKIGCKFEN